MMLHSIPTGVVAAPSGPAWASDCSQPGNAQRSDCTHNSRRVRSPILLATGQPLATVSDCAIIERSACSVSSRQSTRRERLLVPRAARQPRRASWRGVLMVAVRGAAALRPVAPVVARRRCARPSSARHGTRQAVVHPGAVIRLPVRPAECHPRSGNCLRSTHREQEPVPEQAASMCGGWSSEVAEKRLRAPARPCRRAPRPSQRASHPVCVCFSAKPICSGSA